MFTYIIMAGSGAITYLLAQKESDTKNEKWYKEVIAYFMYVMLDMLAVLQFYFRWQCPLLWELCFWS